MHPRHLDIKHVLLYYLFTVGSIDSYLHIAVDPGQNTADFGVNAGLAFFAAASPPAGDPHQVPTALSLTHQRSTTVTLGKKSSYLVNIYFSPKFAGC